MAGPYWLESKIPTLKSESPFFHVLVDAKRTRSLRDWEGRAPAAFKLTAVRDPRRGKFPKQIASLRSRWAIVPVNNLCQLAIDPMISLEFVFVVCCWFCLSRCCVVCVLILQILNECCQLAVPFTGSVFKSSWAKWICRFALSSQING